MRYAIIDKGGKVVNVIEATENYAAPEGATAVPSDTANPGDTWDGKAIVKPRRAPEPEPLAAPQLSPTKRLDALFSAQGITRADLKAWLDAKQ